MTTTIAGALTAIRARAEDAALRPKDTNNAVIPILWQNEDNHLPDQPGPMLFVEIVIGRGQLASFGGGRGQNRYRNSGEINAYALVPRGEGMADALGYAEQFAALFRSYRTDAISCFEATIYPVSEGASIIPPGLEPSAGGTLAGSFACVVASIDFFFDQIG